MAITGDKVEVRKRLAENVSWLKEEMGYGETFDLICHPLLFAGKEGTLFFINGMTKDNAIMYVLRSLSLVKRAELAPDPLEKLVKEYVTHGQVETTGDLHQVVDNVLSGLMVILVEGEEKAILVDVRNYPSRQPAEPDLERVVRGSRDGFIETLVANTVLIRRRLRDPRLRFAVLEAGQRSKTDICVVYLADVADPSLVEEVKGRIKDIRMDGLPMAEKSVEELITPGSYWNPFPKVRYTERPDVAAVHLLEGHILVMVDTSPSVIILPVTLFHHLQHAEEYRQNPTVGVFIRATRFMGIFISVFVLPLWLLLALEPRLRPSWLSFVGPSKPNTIPLLVQFLLAELGIQLMRLSAIHTPQALTTALGIIAAVLVGQVAVAVGLFAPEVVLYVSVAAVGTFATPSYELSMANTLVRIALLLGGGIFRLPGILLVFLAVVLLLLGTRSFGIPYLWPLVPFNGKALLAVLVRSPVPIQNTRPSILHPLDPSRQAAPAMKPLDEHRRRR